MDVTADSTGGLPDALTYHKHIPLLPGKTARRSQKHIVRATAKRCAQDPTLRRPADTLACYFPADAEPASEAPDQQRPQLESDLYNALWDTECRGFFRQARKAPRPRGSASTRALVSSDEAEGRDLARSRVPLPSDTFRIVRRRSLEREEAFCDANTYKGNVRLRRNVGPSDDAQVAELYNMGLLYDDEPSATEPFNLNSIRHEEPVYSIRPAKRARKLNKARGYDVDQPLDLDLSFADLGNDEAIAHYLMSPSLSEAEDNADETIQHPSRQNGQSFAPLRVIYELVSSRPSFDVDTSQPPDLIDDNILSDYDCFSDSELDDTPSQRELHDDGSAAAADGPWVVLG